MLVSQDGQYSLVTRISDSQIGHFSGNRFISISLINDLNCYDAYFIILFPKSQYTT